MSVTTEIERLQTARNTIRTKMVELGLATSADTLDMLADDVDGIENRGAVSANVKEGETYAIPKGYHNGSGTVSGVAGGGNYSLQSKTATPIKKQQSITPDSGYYGLSDVTVAAIPENYQDVSSVTATAADVLATKVIVSAAGAVTTGTMTNNGAVSKTLDTSTTSYTVPKGYHSGTGTVSITTETKSATPTKASQDVTPTSGKVLSKVTVDPIPDNYIDTTDADADMYDILQGKTAYVNGKKITGAMAEIEAASIWLTRNKTSYSIGPGYVGGPTTVRISVHDETVTPSKESQVIGNSDLVVYGSVTVDPIPDEYQDVTGVTATAEQVLAGSVFVDAEGTEVTGTMVDNGAVTGTLGYKAMSYTIPEGYHDGTGAVSIGMVEGLDIPIDNTLLAGMTITPSADTAVIGSISIRPVTNSGIVNTTGSTASAAEILSGETAYVNGSKITGTMANNGAVAQTLNTTTTSYTVPAGYHNGSGTVSITTESKTVTPTKSKQTVSPTSGKVLSSVVVNAIPAAYITTTDATAVAANILTGKTAYVNGSKVTGTMSNNGDVSASMDGMTTTSVTIPAGYSAGGVVSLTSDIEEALAAI